MRLLACARVGLVAIIALVVTCAGAAAAPLVGMGVTPLRVDADVRPGGQARFELTVINTDDGPVSFTFGVTDISGDRDDPRATPVLLGGEVKSPVSGFGWISVPDAVTVPSGQRRTVAVTVRAPADATGGHYAAVIVRGRAVAGGRVTATSRIAVPFLMNAGGAPPPQIKITEVREYQDGGTRVVYTNEGQTHTKPKGTISYRDPVTGRIIRRNANGTCTTALPGGSGECRFDGGRDGGRTAGGSRDGSRGLAGVGPTDGFVELVTEEGTRAKGELPTQWAGTWTGMMLPLAGIALFVMYFLFLRRRRKQRTDADGQLDDDAAWA